MTDITERQREILRHTLGLNRSRKAYRNHFAVSPGSPDHDECRILQSAGFMECIDPELAPLLCFYATEKGACLVEDNP